MATADAVFFPHRQAARIAALQIAKWVLFGVAIETASMPSWRYASSRNST
ncbi:hypothetical protein EPYR_03853 [Erwinia pyrifoliae DSM 12163]|nr:hypothetical protein EPYR_03853 [Erwinia pyrifoliae DSM 12163]